LAIKKYLDRFYGDSYKKYIILPAVLFVVFAFLAFVYPGVEQGIDLKGGTLIVIGTESIVDAHAIQSALNQAFELTDLTVTPFQGGVQIQFGANRIFEEAGAKIESARSSQESNPEQSLTDCSEAVTLLSEYRNPEFTEFSDASSCVAFAQGFFGDSQDGFEEELEGVVAQVAGAENVKEGSSRKTEISPALGQLFWNNAQLVMLIALVAVIIVIFVFFRAFVPSLAVILAASFDILAALALMAVFGISFSLASISSLLMLVGYSVDTDIMLTTRLTKRKFKSVRETASDCLLTGLTMTGTTLAAVTMMLILSALWGLDVIFSIAAVLLFGLIGDLISTWFMNGPILMWYVERKKGVK